MTMHVLLVEDDTLSQSESLLPGLKDQGYSVTLAHTPDLLIEKVQTLWPNLVVFNYLKGHQPEVAALQDHIHRANLNIPYLVVGDMAYWSDYATTGVMAVAPDQLQQLSHDIQDLISNQQNRFIRLPHLIIDCQEHQVLHQNKRSSLTPKEFKLLYLLIQNPDQVLSRKIIMQQVWETDYLGDTRTLDVHIRWLREKIEEKPSQPRRLITIRGVGYRFVLNLDQNG